MRYELYCVHPDGFCEFVYESDDPQVMLQQTYRSAKQMDGIPLIVDNLKWGGSTLSFTGRSCGFSEREARALMFRCKLARQLTKRYEAEGERLEETFFSVYDDLVKQAEWETEMCFRHINTTE